MLKQILSATFVTSGNKAMFLFSSRASVRRSCPEAYIKQKLPPKSSKASLSRGFDCRGPPAGAAGVGSRSGGLAVDGDGVWKYCKMAGFLSDSLQLPMEMVSENSGSQNLVGFLSDSLQLPFPSALEGFSTLLREITQTTRILEPQKGP